ncbi:hypothetical protein M5689_014022 [Euphorbia peplus]|nr:hypothetical protein M5689_014022 [Euphorbia peplus]
MEKEKSGEKMSKTPVVCIPKLRLRCNNPKSSSRNLSPMSLLDRFREAVFRLMMISATHNHKMNANTSSSHYHHVHVHPSADPHNSEAVADCIEFIKNTSVPDHDRD